MRIDAANLKAGVSRVVKLKRQGLNRRENKNAEDGDQLKWVKQLSCLKTVYLAGERADPDTIEWAQDKLCVPVIDHWWQTETGFAIAANPMGLEALPVKIGSPGVAMPGFDVQVLDDAGHAVPAGTRADGASPAFP